MLAAKYRSITVALSLAFAFSFCACNSESPNPASEPVPEPKSTIGPMGKDFSKPDQPKSQAPQLWISPPNFGQPPGQNLSPDTACQHEMNSLRDYTAVPADYTLYQVESDEAYIAHITIRNVDGKTVATSTQAFGSCGELDNRNRKSVDDKIMLSFLFWDRKDTQGVLQTEAVHFWKIQFNFRYGVTETRHLTIEN